MIKTILVLTVCINLVVHFGILSPLWEYIRVEEEATLEERVETLEKEMLTCCETSSLPWGADAGLRQLSEIRQGIEDLTVRVEFLEALLEKEESWEQ